MKCIRSPRSKLSRIASRGAPALIAVLAACAPGARPLAGALTTVALPTAELSTSPQQLRFEWTYKDETFEANGEGVVRHARPARARLDFFLRNGMAGGYAILVDDSLMVPGIDLVRRFLPPVPLLWATLGRLSLPAAPDTVARMVGDTLRADLGHLRGRDASAADGRAWRVSFGGRMLGRVERIEGGRVIEWITRRRNAAGQLELTYVHEQAKRRLALTVTDTTLVEGFDDAIFRRP